MTLEAEPWPSTLAAAARLVRTLEWSQRFWLGYVFAAAPFQAHMIQAQMRAAIESRGGVLTVLRPYQPQDLEHMLAEVLACADSAVIWVEAIRSLDARGGEWTQAWMKAILRTNERRELVRERLGGGLVFAAHPDAKPVIREAGPDLWSIRSGVFELQPPRAQATRGLGTDWTAREARESTRAAVPTRRARSAPLPLSLSLSAGPPTRSFVDSTLLDTDVARAKAGFDLSLSATDLGRTTLRLADRLWQGGREREALAATREAALHYRRAGPSAIVELARTLEAAGRRARLLGEHAAALDTGGEAIEIWRRLAEDDPDPFEVELARSLANYVIDVAGPLGHATQARDMATQAVDTFRRRAAIDPTLRSALSTALDALSVARAQIETPDTALVPAEESMRILRELVVEDPDQFLVRLALTLSHLGGLYTKVGRFEEALAAARESLQIHRQQLEGRRSSSPVFEAAAHLEIANIAALLGDHEQALTSAREAAERIESGTETAQGSLLALALQLQGRALRELGREPEALRVGERELAQWRREITEQPGDGAATTELALSLTRVALQLSAAGNHARALELAREGSALARELAESELSDLPELSDTPELSIITAVGVYTDVLLAAGRTPIAHNSAEDALAWISKLEAEWPSLEARFGDLRSALVRARDLALERLALPQ